MPKVVLGLRSWLSLLTGRMLLSFGISETAERYELADDDDDDDASAAAARNTSWVVPSPLIFVRVKSEYAVGGDLAKFVPSSRAGQ